MVLNDPYSPEDGYYECPDCGTRTSGGGHAGTCPDCDTGMRNLAVARE